MPRRKVRRGSAFFVMNIDESSLCSFSGVRAATRVARRPALSRIGNGVLVAMPCDQIRRAGSCCGAASRMMRADRRHVVGRQLAAERVGQQVLGHRPDEHLGPAEHGAAQSPRRRRRRCRRRAAVAGVDARRRLRGSRQAPTPSKFSIASPIGSISRWQLAHVGLRRCSSIRSFIVSGRRVVASRQRRHVRRRRRRRRAEQGLEHPLAALHRRRAVRVRGDDQDAAVAEQAAARLVGHRHAAEVAAGHARDAVVARQALVDERVVGRQQVEHAAGSRAACWRRAARSRGGTPAAGRRRSPGTPSVRAGRAAGSAAAATGRRSSSTSASARGSASMRRTCAA